jgi:hypothetical protein
MPTSEKPKPQPDAKTPKLAKDFFYRDGPFRADEALHNPILEEGDHKTAEAVTRKRLKKRGWSDEKIDKLMSATPSK